MCFFGHDTTGLVGILLCANGGWSHLRSKGQGPMCVKEPAALHVSAGQQGSTFASVRGRHLAGSQGDWQSQALLAIGLAVRAGRIGRLNKETANQPVTLVGMERSFQGRGFCYAALCGIIFKQTLCVTIRLHHSRMSLCTIP